MQEMPVTEARAQLSDLVSQVAFGRQPVVLTRHGKPLVALVPVSLLDELSAGGHEAGADAGPVVLDLTTRPGDAQERQAIAARHPRTD
jgi:prevent-host-death family protein